MAVRSFPFAGQDEAPEEDYYLLHRETGVVEGLDLTLVGLNWSLSTGAVYASGAMVVVEDVPLTGASTPTGTASPRRDMLVARRTLVPGGGSFGEIALKQGAPAATPADPTPTKQLLGVWEEPLFSWQVSGNGAASTSSIRDLRSGPGVGNRPSIRGTFRRTNGDMVLNGSGLTDLSAQHGIVSRGTGWTTFNPGTCIGYSNPTPGRYELKAHLLTDHRPGRWESLLFIFQGGGLIPLADAGPAAAFGGLVGSYSIESLTGVSFGFRYQTNGSGSGLIRSGSWWSCTWMGEL